MTIAVDAMGGEYAPYEIVKGAIKAAQEFNTEIILVGKRDMLYVQAGRHLAKLGMSIVNASENIDFHESSIESVQNKPDSSIVVGTNLVRDGVASAFVSAGHSGA
ncbi:MAG: phosphate acyltransferase, partial [Chloroflexi bacterium]|nr:phosphate acyltransferase [Chloroflexota bacterium]